VKLAVSSLAWNPQHDDEVRSLLVRRGVPGVEITPLKYWPRPADATPAALGDYRARWADAGVSIVALQAILFGLPRLQLFGSDAERRELEAHLRAMSVLAQRLGARVIVFGAPRNRLRGARSEVDAAAEAAPLLRRAADVARDHDVALCVEPNPAAYGGDFACSIADALALVRAVDHPGFALHLDAGAIAINAETDGDVMHAAREARHFHASEIDLAPVGSGTVNHRHLGALLRSSDYHGWVSIEMRPASAALPEVLDTIDVAIDVASSAYLEQRAT
jgi:sugar phosphate isomerase/epimerase